MEPNAYLVQVLFPVRDNDEQPFPREWFDQARTELTERFGGVTAYFRSPASGAWKEDDGAVVRDDIVIYEVMAEELDPQWWGEYRNRLERQFQQEEMVVRALPIRRL